jgi:hypothetical protein
LRGGSNLGILGGRLSEEFEGCLRGFESLGEVLLDEFEAVDEGV